MALDRGAERFRPAEQLGAGVVAALAGQRAGDVGDGVGVRAPAPRAARRRRQASSAPARARRRRRRAPRRAASRSRSACAGPSASARSDSRVSASASAIPASHCGSSTGRSIHLATRPVERDQMTGEIAAVDRRDVLRVERPQVVRVVPVVEVAAEALEARSSSRASPRAARRCRACRASRSRARRPPRAGRARCSSATSGAPRPASGSSWKLSGGSMWSSAVTKVSKKRQVRRATPRSARASAAPIGVRPPMRRRAARPARDRGGEQPGDQERRGDRPRLRVPRARPRSRPRRPARRRRPSAGRTRADRAAGRGSPARR